MKDLTDRFMAIGLAYKHACEKHPKFVDVLFKDWNVADAASTLEVFRRYLSETEKRGDSSSDDVLLCETYEAMEAYARGDYQSAIREVYDIMAVCLRMIDALEDGMIVSDCETVCQCTSAKCYDGTCPLGKVMERPQVSINVERNCATCKHFVENGRGWGFCDKCQEAGDVGEGNVCPEYSSSASC